MTAPTSDARTADALRPVARAIFRYWPVGLIVAIVVGVAGVLLAWDDPTVQRTAGRVLPPGRIVTFAETQQYTIDLEAQLRSPFVQRRAAVEAGLRQDALIGHVDVARRGQSGVLLVTLRTPEPLEAPELVLRTLVTAAGTALAAPDQAAADRRLLAAQERLEQTRDELTAAEEAKQSALSAAGGIPAALELPAVSSQLAELRVCAIQAASPAAEACAASADELAVRYTDLAARADAETRLDEAVELARSEETMAEGDERAALRVVEEAAAPPSVDVDTVGEQTQQWGPIVRSLVAAVAAALLVGVAVAALVAWRRGDLRPGDGATR